MTPSAKAIGCIDHILILVDDLDRDAEIYRRLGFTLSPKGVHSAAMGSANHTIMLQRDYFELLAIVAPTERNLPWREALAAGGGVAGVALTTEDAAAAGEIWTAAGLASEPLIRFSRAVNRADGVQMEARFEVVTLGPVADAGVRIFVCSQPTREAVWLPELTTHSNTAQAITRLTIGVTDPAASAVQWRRVIPDVAVSAIDGGVRLSAGPHRIDLLGPADETRALGIDYRVADLARARSVLSANGMPFTETAGSLTVAPENACRVRLTFAE